MPFFFQTLSAQNSDSLEILLSEAEDSEKPRILEQLAETYEGNKPEKCAYYAKQLLLFSKNNDQILKQAKAYSLLGNSYYLESKYDSALSVWQKALEIYLQEKDDYNAAEQYNNIGVCYYGGFADYDKALDNYIKSMRKREEIKDTAGIAYSLNNIGNIYYKQNRREKALQSYEKALTFAEKADDDNILSILLNNIGAEYAYKKEYDKSLEYKFRSIELKKKENNQVGIAVTYGSIGSIYKYQNKFDEALEYYEKSIEILRENPNKYYLATLLNYKAGVYQQTAQYNKAVKYLKESLIIAEEIDAKNILENGYLELAKTYKEIKNYKQAFEYQQKYIQIHDSIFSSESDKRLKDAEVRYETEKKQKENELLKNEQQLNELKIAKSSAQRNYMIALAGLFLILAAVIFSRYRYKQKTSVVLEDKNRRLAESEENLKELIETKDKFFSIIAHDLKSPLSALVIVSEMLDDSLETSSPEKLKYYLGSITNAANNLLNLTENLLAWARTQTGKIVFNPEKIDLHHIANQNIMLLKMSADKKNITFENNIKKNTLAFADINLVTAVFRNLLANAVKFTNENGKISLDAAEKEETIEIFVKDNGIGMSEEDLNKLFRIDVDTGKIGDSAEKGTGLGLILCKEFVEKNGGRIWAESKINKGSSFIFTLKKAI